MNVSRMRVEIIRFSLLITITVALISVAVRHGGGDHPATRASHVVSPTTTTTTSASGGQTGGAGSGGNSTTGQVAGRHVKGKHPSAGDSGASTGGQPVATLPHTGGTQIAQLAGLAALLIAAGSFSMTVSRRSVR